MKTAAYEVEIQNGGWVESAHVSEIIEVVTVRCLCSFEVWKRVSVEMHRPNWQICRRCRRPFLEGDQIYAAFAKESMNRWICLHCAEQVTKELGQELPFKEVNG